MIDSGSTATAWIAVGGTSFGVLVGFVGQFFTNRAALDRERESRREMRRDAAKQRRSEFERDNLLALQDAASELLRHASAMVSHGQRHRRNALSADFPDELVDAGEKCFHLMTKLSARVIDDQVRAECKSFKEHFLKVFAGFEILPQGAGDMEDAFVKLNEVIGDRFRALEDELIAA